MLRVSELELYIKKALNCLRECNPVDQLHYVSSLLLYKRLNDVFVETAKRIEVEEGSTYGWEDKDEHNYFVPENARWNIIMKAPLNDLGVQLESTFELLERDNPQLNGVFTSVDICSVENLAEIVKIIDELDLSDKNLELSSATGIALSNVIQDLDKTSGSTLSPTPTMLSRLMVHLVKPTENMKICDPTVGIGGCLVEVSKFIENNGGKQEYMTFYGHELNFSSWALCKRNLILHNIFDAMIDKRDTLRFPKLQADDKLLKYDRIVSVPPFSKQNWGREEASHDPFERFRWGVPPKSSSDYAFIQHVISTLNENGKASMVVPEGVLLRSGVEGKIRKSLIEDDLIESIILLPSNLLPDTYGSICVIMINRSKSSILKDKILFVDASKDFQTNRMKKELRVEDVDKIVSTYENGRNLTGYSRVVSIKRIKDEDYSLVPYRYIQNYDENVTELFKNLKVDRVTLEEITDDIRMDRIPENDEDIENNNANSIFYPLVHARKPVLMSLENENRRTRYAEIILDSNKADSSYVCQFLNSQMGQRLRDMLHENFAHGATHLSVRHLRKLVVNIPSLDEQFQRLQLQSKIRNTTTALHMMEQKLWGSPEDTNVIKNKLDKLIHGESLGNWFESLPYPLASILLLYERSHRAQEKERHLLRFFEAFSQFIVVILLSHFYKERMISEEVTNKIKGKIRNVKISSFGTWITLGRKLATAAKTDASFEDLFQYSKNDFLKMITDSSIYDLLKGASAFRNDDAHGGIVTEEISKERLVHLEAILSKLHEKIGNRFEQVTILSPVQSSLRSGEFYSIIYNLVGPNQVFKIEEDIITNEAMDTVKLYLLYQGEKQPLELLPFITMSMEKKSCHFYSKLEEQDGKEVVRYVSYHYEKEPVIFNNSPDLRTFLTEYLI
jgi:type I restriction enzyme M protein